jgi:HAD superfamily hydrolase (TIGR01509 family)
MTTVRGIGFDLDHTLAIDNRLEQVALLQLLDALVLKGGQTVGTLADEITAIDALLTQQRRGDFSIDEAVRRFVAAHGLEPERRYAEAFRSNAVAMVDEFVVPLPDVDPMLAALRERGIAVAILSNGWNPLQARKAERARFRGPVLVSSEIGVQKPDLRAFERLLETLETDPDETWYVGDDPRGDVAGSQRAGVTAIWMDWEQKAYPSELAPPEHTIRDFRELVALLPAPVRAQ